MVKEIKSNAGDQATLAEEVHELSTILYALNSTAIEIKAILFGHELAEDKYITSPESIYDAISQMKRQASETLNELSDIVSRLR